MSDNVDFYRRFVFRPPSARTLAAAVAVLGALFGIGSVLVLSPFSALRINLAGAVIAAAFFYVIPAFLSSELTARLGGVDRRWTYLMSGVDQTAVFFFSLTVPFADTVSEAWQVLWLALATVYLINLVMILMARGRKKLQWNLLYAFIFPGTVLAAFHLSIGRLVGIPRILYLENSLLFLLSAFLLLLTIGLYTFIMRGNIDMSAFDFFPPLILGETRSIPGGVVTEVHHQVLEVDNGQRLRFNVPWVHPGPVDGFGGGRLTSELIDAGTFMLHVPSYHTLDLAEPGDMARFRDMPEAERSGKASELLKLEKNGFTLWGRKYEGGKVVYVENQSLDDYEPSIAYDLKEEYPDLCLVDLHNHVRGGNWRPWLQRMDRDARVLEEAVGEMVGMLEDADMGDYSAGFAGENGYRCLVEEVNGQKTCLLGVNASDAPAVLHEVADGLDFDHALPFTTDSHENLVDMAASGYGREDLEEAVEEAEGSISEAEAGLGGRTVEDVRVLGKDYEGLITTLNVMARLVPITILLYYIGIVFLVL